MKKIFIAICTIIVAACTVFESDHENYWLNNVRPYKVLPILFYEPQVYDAAEKLSTTKTMNTHSFKHNVVVSANLGQRMVDAQTYTIKHFTKEKIIANMNGSIKNANNQVLIGEGTEYLPLGEVKLNGSYYLLIEPNGDGNILLIDEDGKFLDIICKIYNGQLLLSREKAIVQPENLGIEPAKDIRETIDAPQVQFEIKYDGFENDLMAFTYADFSNATSSKGYFQRFVFPKNQDLININGVKFKI